MSRRRPVGWCRAEADWWPMIAASLPLPWPEEAVWMDLRWHRDQERVRGERLMPGRVALAARWGWRDHDVRRAMKDEGAWADPSWTVTVEETPAKAGKVLRMDNHRATSAQPPGHQRTTTGVQENADNQPESNHPATTEPPAHNHPAPHARVFTDHRSQITDHDLNTPPPTPPVGGRRRRGVRDRAPGSSPPPRTPAPGAPGQPAAAAAPLDACQQTPDAGPPPAAGRGAAEAGQPAAALPPVTTTQQAEALVKAFLAAACIERQPFQSELAYAAARVTEHGYDGAYGRVCAAWSWLEQSGLHQRTVSFCGLKTTMGRSGVPRKSSAFDTPNHTDEQIRENQAALVAAGLVSDASAEAATAPPRPDPAPTPPAAAPVAVAPPAPAAAPVAVAPPAPPAPPAEVVELRAGDRAWAVEALAWGRSVLPPADPIRAGVYRSLWSGCYDRLRLMAATGQGDRAQVEGVIERLRSMGPAAAPVKAGKGLQWSGR